ncbi:Hypothetical protein LUCI_5017 [Lucifera butyrica]|uniref:Phage tail collar domain-containing protein n=1 Tax=Lucifera butyrica TaxID=1351585 RepID=A0A498REH0_9FIRM|nr:tail fiber protein [Lucifera butyrica]VBB09719.1 Hypothetical protein LUCI_5017 [Lucifera butyrica]
MSRTVFCPEEVIVISNGKADIGKIVELGNDGKFDPSVIPVIDDLQTEITAEVTARKEADEQLQANVDAEALARTNADAKLQSNMDAEASARTSADSDLQAQITKEVTTRTDGDTALQSNIDAEAATRASADKDLQAQIDILKGENAFSNVLVNGTTIEAASATDTIELAAGTNIALNADGANKKVTIAVDGKVASAAEADTAAECSGNASTATKLAAARTINGVSFDGSADITITQVNGKSIATIDQIPNSLAAGAIQYFARETAPDGWLKADGSAVSRTQYADLFAAVGTMFGAGDGSTTFNLPDLRGEFIRGFDDGRGVDSNRILGSSQSDATKTHYHQIESNYNDYYAGTGNGGPFRLTGNDGDTSVDGHADFYTNTENSTGGTETRPRNMALLACIKY